MKSDRLIFAGLVLNGLGMWACAAAILYGSSHGTMLVSTPRQSPFVIDSALGGLDLNLSATDLGTLEVTSGAGGLDLNVDASGGAVDINLNSPSTGLDVNLNKP